MTRAVLTILLALSLLGCANLREGAHWATGVDATTTAIGVGTGVAREVNPIITSPAAFVALMVARVAGTEYVNAMPEPRRTEYLSAMNSIWWGYGANNAALLVFHALGFSSPVGAVVGLFTAAAWWQSTADQRLFAQMCAAERATNPKMECMFRGVAM